VEGQQRPHRPCCTPQGSVIFRTSRFLIVSCPSASSSAYQRGAGPGGGQAARIGVAPPRRTPSLLHRWHPVQHPGVEGEVVGLDFNPALGAAAWEALPGFQVRHTTHNTRHTTLSFLGRGRERQGEAVGRGGERDGDAVPRSVVRRRLLDPSHAAPDVEKALVELHGVLKPGGRLVICQADMDTRTRVYSSGTHHRTRAHLPRTLHTITTTPGWNICRPGTGARPGEDGE
jgi:SAM-dependent methyltransferase